MTTENKALTIYNHFQKIHVLLDDGDRRALSKIDLTPSQYNLLYHLNEHAKERLTISELAEMLICTRSNATRLVQRLQDQGLVRKVRPRSNQRLVHVSITPKGAKMLKQAQTVQQASLDERLGTLGPEGLDALKSLTAQIITTLENQLNS